MMKKRLTIVIVALIAAAALAFLVTSAMKGKRQSALRVSGVVEGTEVNLSAKIAGTIQEICCREGDTVREGQTAVRLEAEDASASVAQARAGIERARADIASAESAVENARAGLLAAEADVRSAEAETERSRVRADELKLEMQRARDLYRKDFISKALLDQAVAAYDAEAASLLSSKARTASSKARKDSAATQVRTAASQVAASAARLKEAEANLSFYESRLRDMSLVSPISGTVVFKALEKGEHAAAGSAIMTIVATDDLTVRIDLEETAVAPIALGSAARITADGLPGRVFNGRVVEIGRYAEFATQRDVTRGRQDIKTFRVKVRPENTGGLLKPGMTVLAELPVF